MAPSPFGSDWSTFTADGEGGFGLDPTMAPLTGRALLGEACARRLSTRRGSLRGAEDYGYDLMTRVGARVSAVGRKRMEASIEAELVKDDRVKAAKVVSFTKESEGRLKLNIQITDSTDGTFPLVLAVSALSIEVLQANQT